MYGLMAKDVINAIRTNIASAGAILDTAGA
jgi:hypothetical protein